MMRSLLTRVVDAALALALPPVCLCCDRFVSSAATIVCGCCWNAVQRLSPPWCERCGHPGELDPASCRWCALIPSTVARVRSWCWVPEGVGGDLVHKLKYGGWLRLGHTMSARMATLGAGDPGGAAVSIVPVPLGRGRQRERGYNQAETLAEGLAARWRAALVGDALIRRRETRSQVLLTPDERSANVQSAFVAGFGANALRGTHVVLIDDVITTAATLSASADALQAVGALSISFVTFGRARAAWDRGASSRSFTT